MLHGDIPKDVAVVFQSSVLHRTGSNLSGQTRVAYLIQNQLSSLVRMEGEMIKLDEYASMLDLAIDNEWIFKEIYDNYPFPADLANPLNAPQPGKLAPRTLGDHIQEYGLDNLKLLNISQRKLFFREKLSILHGYNL